MGNAQSDVALFVNHIQCMHVQPLLCRWAAGPSTDLSLDSLACVREPGDLYDHVVTLTRKIFVDLP